MNKLKIKTKLLIHSLLIQIIVLGSFSFILYGIYKEKSIDSIHTKLNIVLLDIYKDLKDDESKALDLDEEEEFDFRPLFLRVSRLESKELSTFVESSFPKEIDISLNTRKLQLLDIGKTFRINNKNYFYQALKVKKDNKIFIIEGVTITNTLNREMNKLLYILLITTPIILILALVGSYFLIYKSFKPINELLKDLSSIQINNLSKRLKRNNNQDEIDTLSKEINELLSRLEQSFKKVSQFSSNASHELKTPLTIIRGEIELALRKERTKEEYKETLENCQNEILIIQQTVEHLLFLAKSKDYLENNIEQNYLDEITLESINELNSYAKLRKVNLLYKINEALSIEGNKELLKIAIKNVIKNAITFSFENRTVQIKNYSDKGFNIISISDKGIGIKEEEQKKVFEEFYRTDKSRNKESGGTGLGLSICKKIVEMHKGRIELKSKENDGTTIFIKLPKDIKIYNK